MDLFESARDLAAYVGLSPMQRQSGSSVLGRTVLSKKGNSHLRKALFFPAITAQRWNPHLLTFAQRLLAKGKAKMVVIGALMRKLIHLIYGVLKSGKAYDPSHNPHHHRKENLKGVLAS